MNVSDIMTRDPACLSTADTLRDVARTMREQDCGAVPIVEGGRLVGIITDRDLAIRALAEGKDAGEAVGDLMTRDPLCVDPSDDIATVQRAMADRQVRRVPVVDHDGACVGIVSQADLARAAQDGARVTEHEVAIVLEKVSEPARRPFDSGAADTLEQTM